MLASLADAPLDDPQLVYEPKYDGIRAIVEVEPGRIRLWSRLGNEKTRQFPEIAAALERWARTLKAPVVLDGEIVALNGKGEPAGFQQLQGRINVKGFGSSRQSHSRDPHNPPDRPDPPGLSVAFIAFDILKDGKTDLRGRPLTERRATLERVFGQTRSPLLRISTMVRGDGRAMYTQALDQGWEGLLAKRANSLYRSGKRTPDWRKLKIVHEQEFVICGWTEPRETRSHFGALLLGVYQNGATGSRSGPAAGPVYIGSVGTGFDTRELARVMTLLKPLETEASAFTHAPRTNERAHWIRPTLVAQVRFTEWTTDGMLRHPVYLGMRNDKKPADVRREDTPRVPHSSFQVQGSPSKTGGPRTRNQEAGTRNPEPGTQAVIDQLSALEDARRDGAVTLPDGDSINVTNLHKVFWQKQKLTKGDLFRYYARVAPVLLPAIADRPLVMKRFPNGVTAPPFYQHRAPDVPAGVRSEVVGVAAERPQIIGGGLKTLLYTTQLAAISQDPWFSRVAHPESADYAAFDLDPSEGVPFARVLDVARWIRDELDWLGALGVPKSSGADGLHIYIPLPAGTPYDAGLIVCQIVATVVVQKHPRVATIERSVKARGKRVYIDCLQNIQGKTLASAYSARASDYAGVSTPVTWQEIDKGFDRREFTIDTVPARVKNVGDLWAALRKSKGIDLTRVTKYA